jgi:hypothetical protein
VRRKVLRCGSVGFWLAILRSVAVNHVLRCRLSFLMMFFGMLALRSVRFVVRRVFFDVRHVVMEHFVMRFVGMLAGAGQYFTWQDFDRSAARRR